MNKTIYFIRHGEAEHNVGYKKDGIKAYSNPIYQHSRLTEWGSIQTQDCKNKLDDGIEEIYVSPLTRTLQTAEILFSNKDIICSEDIRELGYEHPCNQRKTKSQLQEEFPKISFDGLIVNNDKFYIYGDDHDRFDSFYATLLNSKSKVIAVVSHESYILAFIKRKFPNYDIKSIDNCEIIMTKF